MADMNCPICGALCVPAGCGFCSWKGEKAIKHPPLKLPTEDPAMDSWKREVHDAEYYQALADGRCLRWRPIATRPTDRPVIIGGPGQLGWTMRRMEAGASEIVSFDDIGEPTHATHWCEDMLGTPYVVVRTPATSGYLQVDR